MSVWSGHSRTSFAAPLITSHIHPLLKEGAGGGGDGGGVVLGDGSGGGGEEEEEKEVMVEGGVGQT